MSLPQSSGPEAFSSSTSRRQVSPRGCRWYEWPSLGQCKGTETSHRDCSVHRSCGSRWGRHGFKRCQNIPRYIGRLIPQQWLLISRLLPFAMLYCYWTSTQSSPTGRLILQPPLRLSCQSWPNRGDFPLKFNLCVIKVDMILEPLHTRQATLYLRSQNSGKAVEITDRKRIVWVSMLIARESFPIKSLGSGALSSVERLCLCSIKYMGQWNLLGVSS